MESTPAPRTNALARLFLRGGRIYSYGIFDNLTQQQLTGDPLPSQTLLSTQQARYTFGPSLKIPMSAILNRANDIRAAKAEKERALGMRGVITGKIKEELIKRYIEVINTHEQLLIDRVLVDTYDIQTRRASREFEDGVIDIVEFTRLQQMHNEAIKGLQRQKSNFLLAVMLLETWVGKN